MMTEYKEFDHESNWAEELSAMRTRSGFFFIFSFRQTVLISSLWCNEVVKEA